MTVEGAVHLARAKGATVGKRGGEDAAAVDVGGKGLEAAGEGGEGGGR